MRMTWPSTTPALERPRDRLPRAPALHHNERSSDKTLRYPSSCSASILTTILADVFARLNWRTCGRGDGEVRHVTYFSMAAHEKALPAKSAVAPSPEGSHLRFEAENECARHHRRGGEGRQRGDLM